MPEHCTADLPDVPGIIAWLVHSEFAEIFFSNFCIHILVDSPEILYVLMKNVPYVFVDHTESISHSCNNAAPETLHLRCFVLIKMQQKTSAYKSHRYSYSNLLKYEGVKISDSKPKQMVQAVHYCTVATGQEFERCSFSQIL